MSNATPTERREREDHAHPTRRRASDRLPECAAQSRAARARSLFQRFRQPIIGLGLAGAALPIVNAGSSGSATQPTTPTPTPEPQQDAPPQTVAQHAQEVEENVVEQIAVSKEEQAREEAVSAAVKKHGISREMAEDIYDIALEEGIPDARLAYGLVKTESTFKERAQSGVGARGLTQVMPRTARWLMPGTKTEDLYNRQTNLRLGFRYLEKMIDKYDGNTRLALLAYNRGPGTVDKVLKRGGNPDNGYADKVLRGG